MPHNISDEDMIKILQARAKIEKGCSVLYRLCTSDPEREYQVAMKQINREFYRNIGGLALVAVILIPGLLGIQWYLCSLLR